MFKFFIKNKKQLEFQENYDFLVTKYPRDIKILIIKEIQNEVMNLIEQRSSSEKLIDYLNVYKLEKAEAILSGSTDRQSPNWIKAELKINLCELLIEGERLPSQSAINAMQILFGWLKSVEKN